MHQNKTIHEELEALSPFWTTIQSQMPYVVPANYFESLPSVVRAKIETEAVHEELELVAPLLNTIPKQTGYQMPVAQHKILPANIVGKPSATVFTWPKLAIAAALIGAMVLVNFMYTNQKQSVDYSAYIGADHQQIIQTISDSTLTAYLDLHEKLIITPDVSDQELLEYIQSSN